MELLLKQLSNNKNWRLIQKIVLVVYTIYLPLRILLHLGLINPTADFFLGFLTVFAPIVILILFPYNRFNAAVKIISLVILFFFAACSLFFIFFKFLAVPDVLRLGEDPSLKEQTLQYENPFVREVTYISNCGATCSLDIFRVKELVLLNIVKIRIPGTYTDLSS